MEYSPTSNPISDSSLPETSSSVANEEVFILAAGRPKKRAGRKKFKETRHPVYRSVRRRNSGKWVCELRHPTSQKRIWLGTYPTPEMAARAHDVASLALRGNMACLNFADSVWRMMPVPAWKDAKDLRKAAVEAAEAFRPSATGGEEVYDQQQRSEELAAAFSESYDVFCEGWDMAGPAEGVMLSPPPCLGWSFSWDEVVESDAEVELWSF